LQADLTAYFADLGLPVPKVITKTLPGSRGNNPADLDASIEVALDMQIAGAVAPAATLLVVFAPNTWQGFCDAVQEAALVSTVVSVSWGAPEIVWEGRARARMSSIIQQAAQRGVNVFVAAGDAGSSDGVVTGLGSGLGSQPPSVADFPASCPFAVACGGTTLVSDGVSIFKETVWNSHGVHGSTGGAYSSVFPKPDYQSALVPGLFRGVPDISGVADPGTGFRIRHNGRYVVVGGTSAVAPLYAGLTARLVQASNKFLNPVLYANPGQVAADITVGNNGAFSATHGWDPCSGLGRLQASALPALLTRIGQTKK
jgi:kumamolisin